MSWAEAVVELRARMRDPTIRKPKGAATKAGFTTKTCAGCGEVKKGNPERQRWFELPPSDHNAPFCTACASWCRSKMTPQQEAAIQASIDAHGPDYDAAAATLLNKVKSRLRG